MGEKILLITAFLRHVILSSLYLVIQLSGWYKEEAAKAFSCLWVLCVHCGAHEGMLGFLEAMNAGFMVYEEEPSMLWKSVWDSFTLPFVLPICQMEEECC